MIDGLIFGLCMGGCFLAFILYLVYIAKKMGAWDE